MKNLPKKHIRWTKKKYAVLALFVILILSAVPYTAVRINNYRTLANRADIVEIRELILLSIRAVKKDAPVDPKTGDIYFPESRLYLPNPGQAVPFTYLQDIGDITDSQSELSISTYPVRGTTEMYTATNLKSMFDAVPKLQACSRGIKVVYNKFPATDSTNTLKHTVRLENGRDLYIYIEKGCPELKETADLLKNIKSY